MSDAVTTHEATLPPEAYAALVGGSLRHDLRRIGEHPFAPGDLVRYREEPPCSDRVALARVSYVTWTDNKCALSDSGLDPDFAILSLTLLDAGTA